MRRIALSAWNRLFRPASRINRRRRLKPLVTESLETRALLSTVLSNPAPAVGPVSVAPAQTSGNPLVRTANAATRNTLGDLDGDGRADLAVWRPSNGHWYARSLSGQVPAYDRWWGLPGDIPAPADFNGDGKTDMAVFRPDEGRWYISITGSNQRAVVPWGLPGDVPVPADFDGDSKADLAVWRPSNGRWYVVSPTGKPIIYHHQWGLPGDVPVPADYNGDGRADMAIFRPSQGKWYLNLSGVGEQAGIPFGVSNDVPVPADYNGDGKADLAIWRPTDGRWYAVSLNGSVTHYGSWWGLPGDIPTPADYDGDGRADLTIFRPSEARWYLSLSGNITRIALPWGQRGDIPATTTDAARFLLARATLGSFPSVGGTSSAAVQTATVTTASVIPTSGTSSPLPMRTTTLLARQKPASYPFTTTT